MYKKLNFYVICLITFFIFSCEKPNKTELVSTTEKTVTPIKIKTISNQEFDYDSVVLSWQKQTAQGYAESELSYKIIYGDTLPFTTVLAEKIPFSDTSYNATEQLKNGGTFYWQLLLYHKGRSIISADINKITVKPKKTLTPIKLITKNNQVLNHDSVVFSWQKQTAKGYSLADLSYKIKYGNSTPPDTTLAEKIPFSDTSYNATEQLKNGGTFYWQLLVYHKNNIIDTSGINKLTVKPKDTTKTLTPIKLITSNNQTLNYDSVVFSWQKQTAKGYSLANLSYKIKYGNSTPPATTLVEKIPISDTSYNATAQLKNGGTFYWQLLVYHKNNIIDNSGINKLTVKPKDTLTPIKLITKNNQIFNYDSVVFSWQKQTAKGYSLADLSYKIKYGNSTPPATTLVEKIPISDTSYNATAQLKNGGTFYWQLLVYHKNNIIDNSGINKLTVKPKDTIKFTKFSLVDENGNSIKANINYNTKEITFHEFGNDTIISRLNKAVFETNKTTFTAKIGDSVQTSGTTENLFSKGDVIYKISDGENTETYTVKQIKNKIGYNSFVFELTTTATDKEFKLPLTAAPDGDYNFDIDWGDGSPVQKVTSNTDLDATHVFPNNNQSYIVKISGKIKGWRFNYYNDAKLLSKILQWGTLNLGNAHSYFAGASNLTQIETNDILDLSGTTILYRMFADCSKLKTIKNIDNWDVSKVTDMSSMFRDAETFNQNLSKWGNKVGKVEKMTCMFCGTKEFNGDISDWDVSNVTRMDHMFSRAGKFDQDLLKWGEKLGKVNDMYKMFAETKEFNGNISNWIVNNVTNMEYMFGKAEKFNGDIKKWIVSNVTNMKTMFNNSKMFKKDISGWNVTSVTNCSGFSSGSVLPPSNLPTFTNCTP